MPQSGGVIPHKITTRSFLFTIVSEVPTISSLQNPTVRQVVRLRDNRQRQRERIVVVDGVREIEHAIAAGLSIRSLFVAESEKNVVVRLTAHVPHAVILVSEAVLNKIAFGQHHRDAVGLFDEPIRSLSQLKLSDSPLVVVLDGIEKPGNVGAVFRSADAIGADAVVICEGGCDLFNPSVIRASLGTVFSVPCAQADRDSTLSWLHEKSLAIVTARVDATATYWDVDYRPPIAIVIGSEAHGLGNQWQRSPMDSQAINVCIPMHGAADSLNASVSAALLMFEARRQRDSKLPV